jgi:mRNA interferase RelE/StbE
MASYSLDFKPSFQKDLKHLPHKIVSYVMRRTEQLIHDPFPRLAVKLSGAERLYRVRVGDYRIVYEVDTETKQITIQHVRHRREVYRVLS